MTTWCRQVRGSLTSGELTRDEPGVAEHLELCADCAGFAQRLELFRAALRDHHAGVEPDPTFAVRIRGRIPDTPAQLIGGAALRLLPAGALAAALLAIAVVTSAGGIDGDVLGADATATGPIDDPLGWLLEAAADDPVEPDR